MGFVTFVASLWRLAMYPRLGMFFHGMSSLGCERKLFNRLDLLDLFYKFSDRTTVTLYFLHLNTFLSSSTNRTNNIETAILVV